MSVKKMKKALKKLSAIKKPSKELNEVIYMLQDLIDTDGNTEALSQVQENQEKHTLIRNNLDKVEDVTLSYDERRLALTDVLEAGAKVSFNYQKKDNSVRSVNVVWNDDYTYDVPPEGSDFIYMYDEDDDFFKHFKIDKISSIVYDLD